MLTIKQKLNEMNKNKNIAAVSLEEIFEQYVEDERHLEGNEHMPFGTYVQYMSHFYRID